LTLVGVSCRRDWVQSHGESRDSLDARWLKFLERCELVPVLLPNNVPALSKLIERVRPRGLLLTGGGSISQISGEMDDRDAAEAWLLEWAEQGNVPVIGVCRGLQVLLARHGARLAKVEGHVRAEHFVEFTKGSPRHVNSFHDYACTQESILSLRIIGRTRDGVIEMIEHDELPWLGIGWHPERQDPFSPADLELFRCHFIARGLR
jgi:N5-(cytidine 5'-diphosphoramidyl)-L-glutamine hydrolase